MGVASYREDIFFRFLESTDRTADTFVLAGPPGEVCPFCGAQFDNQPSLIAHLSDAHRGDRPILLVHGREPDRYSRVGYRMRKDRIVIRNCTSARLRVNGREQVDVALNEIAPLLADQEDSVVELELENKFEVSAEPVRQSYRMAVLVPQKRALDDVDCAFVEHLGTATPHMALVANFLSDTRSSGIAREYADALAAYARGVLIKDQDRTSGVTLRPAEARDLYGDALSRLQSVPRLLPNVICALIRFAINDFSVSEQSTGVARLDRVLMLLAPLAGRKEPDFEMIPKAASERTIALCPIDHGVDQVLRLGESLLAQRHWGPLLHEECRNAASIPILEAADRQKVLAIWAATALRFRANREALEPLRQLRSTFPFGKWAGQQLSMADEVSL
jgi:hypothetical protein